jgi:cytochrome c
MKHLNPLRYLFAVIAAFAIALMSTVAHAEERGSKAEAQAMVKKAIDYYVKNGREKAFAEIMKNPGTFVDRDLYVVVYSMQGEPLAHINPKMVNKSMIDLRDADGKYFVRERVEAAAKNESGWQKYKFFNPAAKKIEPKEMYWEKHDKLIFGCGVYTPG